MNIYKQFENDLLDNKLICEGLGPTSNKIWLKNVDVIKFIDNTYTVSYWHYPKRIFKFKPHIGFNNKLKKL